MAVNEMCMSDIYTPHRIQAFLSNDLLLSFQEVERPSESDV